LTPEKTLTRNFKESGGKGKFRRRQLSVDISKYRSAASKYRNFGISKYRHEISGDKNLFF